MAKILIVDDDVASCRTLQLHLQGQGHEVDIAHSVAQALTIAEKEIPQLVILDIHMPGRSGLEGLPDFKRAFPKIRIIMITAFHDMQSTIEAMQKGADDYIHKPIDIDELDAAIDKIISFATADEGLVVTSDSTAGVSPLTMVGHSRAMKEIFKTIGMVAKNPATVLITGESGTGKELVARAIHRSGVNPEGPFVAVNCAALVETLLESDMFGHEKGSFTGAVGRQAGKFALARDGTIFLDEVSEMSLAMQAKLLRVVQHKDFTPIGAMEPQTTNTRIIAATNVDLIELVSSKDFRDDLYYRLQVVNIHLPPLRERMEDLFDLIQALLSRTNRELHRNVTHIARDALECLEHYHWPGNVRELENVLMKCVALSSGDTITRDLLPVPDHQQQLERSERRKEGPPQKWSLEQMEKVHVTRILETTNWHKGQACEILGISRPRLRRMIRLYGITPPPGAGDDGEEAS
ncbi:MAG: sigma-54-dependent Fis family transcriptional regulator [Gammaproteobacteria bacterium]|nr:sigma-54-dependent Fis family transcriptional regulator [Gammaproteobacteria bacterium]